MSIVTADIWSGIEAVITSTTGNRVAVLSGPRVRIPPTPPSHPNTLDQWAKSPVISRCSGLFMLENFQSIRWLNGNGAEVRTGVGPLLFHIQAELWRQRPFSEGCGGEIPEKTKKNLSQNYGRWIVGFHKPMTSAFFALKKGATDWRLEMSEENRTSDPDRKCCSQDSL